MMAEYSARAISLDAQRPSVSRSLFQCFLCGWVAERFPVKRRSGTILTDRPAFRSRELLLMYVAMCRAGDSTLGVDGPSYELPASSTSFALVFFGVDGVVFRHCYLLRCAGETFARLVIQSTKICEKQQG
jgi:hypothetical protein